MQGIPNVEEWFIRMDFKFQRIVADIIEAVGLSILRICTYLIFFIQKIWSYILIVLGPIAVGMALILGFESSLTSWISKFININLYSFVAFTVINIGQQLIMYSYIMEIDRYEKMIGTSGSVDSATIMAFINGNGMLHITLFSVVAYIVTAKNRNNFRASLSIFFSFLEENEYIIENFIKKIKFIDAKPQRHKTYTVNQENLIYEILAQQDKNLLLFIKFISYNFLRPIEVCRLRVKNIDLDNAQLTIDTKTKEGKIKIIPKILAEELNFLKNYSKEDFIFTPNGVGQWSVSETGRRDYWTKRFKKVKKQLNLDKDYTIYSFRHTFVTKLYRELRMIYPPFETKSRLMLITGHTTITALDKYLRDIDAELPEDYSHLLK